MQQGSDIAVDNRFYAPDQDHVRGVLYSVDERAVETGDGPFEVRRAAFHCAPFPTVERVKSFSKFGEVFGGPFLRLAKYADAKCAGFDNLLCDFASAKKRYQDAWNVSRDRSKRVDRLSVESVARGRRHHRDSVGDAAHGFFEVLGRLAELYPARWPVTRQISALP